METETDVPPQASGFRRILLCVDSSDASRCAARFARWFAQHGAIAESSSALANTAAAVRRHVIDLAKEKGDVAHALAGMAKAAHADLMVLGTRQHHGLVRWLDPSVTDRLSQLAPCAMVVVPDGLRKSGRNRVSAHSVCGRRQSDVARCRENRRFACNARDTHTRDLCRRPCDTLQRFRADDTSRKRFCQGRRDGDRRGGAAPRIAAQCTRAHVSANLVSTDISADDVSHALLRDAERWNADVIVMGTHGRRGVARAFFGSVANRVASLAKIPLMLVRDQHEEPTPVQS